MKPKSKPQKRAYDTASRREEAEKTRAQIVEAASKLLRTVRPENLSYADVAALADVAVRTVYRHFPEPVDLLRAVARETIARFAPEGLAETRPETAEQLAAFHRTMSSEPTLFRIFMAAPVRAELDFGNVVQKLYADAFEGLAPEERTALAGLLELLASPFAWEVLHTLYSLPAERITRACLAASQWIADGVRRHPDFLDPRAPTPPLFRAGSSAKTKGKNKQ
ncbi:MAG TPA: TetR family transcriptional regulator [Polyangiaceae bacterium]|nr:TetR family transcriptional regulator [Polyangiaceae bacterium]